MLQKKIGVPEFHEISYRLNSFKKLFRSKEEKEAGGL